MLNDNDLLKLLIILTGGLFTTTVIFGALWIRSRERALRSKLTQQGAKSVGDDVAHVIHAVDAIAIEVERISEAQRFTAQVLAERLDLPAGPKRVPERVITPH
jgi:hypothetical protein